MLLGCEYPECGKPSGNIRPFASSQPLMGLWKSVVIECPAGCGDRLLLSDLDAHALKCANARCDLCGAETRLPAGITVRRLLRDRMRTSGYDIDSFV